MVAELSGSQESAPGNGRYSYLIVQAALFCIIVIAGSLITIAPSSAHSGISQTDVGESLYAAHCASCHGATHSGGQFGPSLKGPSFIARWSANPAELQKFIAANMPPANPGMLTDDESAQISAALLKSRSLPEAALSYSASPKPILPPEHVGAIPAQPHVFMDAKSRKALSDRKALLASLTPVTDQMLAAPASEDWLTWRRSAASLGHSPLRQINRENVQRLALAWSWSLPVGSNEIAPIVHKGVIFVSSANQVHALDGASGTLLWRYTREIPPRFRGSIAMLQRNIAIYGSNIYLSTADRHVIALDARTGKMVWDTEIIPPDENGGFLSAGPVAARGRILQSISGGPGCKKGCAVVGLDARTGERLWRFDTIAAPGAPGGDSWHNTPADLRTGGAVWVAGSYDPDNKLVYYGTGGTYYVTPLLTGARDKLSDSHAGLYTNSTIALDPESGRLIWHHQHFPGEAWDLDEAFERALITLPINGRDRKLVVSTGKLGIMDALDRTTGQYMFSKDFGLQNIVSAIDPETGRRTIRGAVAPVPNKTMEVCPSPEGVRNWMAIAYDPVSRTMFLPMEETCMDYTWRPKGPMDARESPIDIGWSVKPVSKSDGNYGRLEAVDMISRRTLWIKRSRAPLSSSLLSTAGGLIFSGARDRRFSAIDKQSGDILWETRLSAVPNASPITYGVNGRQFIAIVAGGGGPHDTESREITPEIDDATASTTLMIFALPSSPKSQPQDRQNRAIGAAREDD